MTGKRLADASVKLRQVRHHFGFGTAVNQGALLHGRGVDQEAYHNAILAFFNRATLENGMKWGPWEHDVYPFREEAVQAHRWLIDHGLDVRGTAMVWPAWDRQNPPGLEDLDANALRQRVIQRIREVSQAFKGGIIQWDVVNEPRTATDFQKVLGGSTLSAWFKLAHASDPTAKLFLNEYGILNGPERNLDLLEQQIKQLLRERAPIHGVGLQAHLDEHRLPSPERMLAILDRLGKTGLAVEVTEFDLDCADEELQADYTRDFYTLLFSHPAVTGITTWGFWEGNHWRPQAAYFRQNWEYKPNGVALATLLVKAWRTEEEGATDDMGQFEFRGFHGTYEAEIIHEGQTMVRTFELKPGAPATRSLIFNRGPPVEDPPGSPSPGPTPAPAPAPGTTPAKTPAPAPGANPSVRHATAEATAPKPGAAQPKANLPGVPAPAATNAPPATAPAPAPAAVNRSLGASATILLPPPAAATNSAESVREEIRNKVREDIVAPKPPSSGNRFDRPLRR